MGQFSMQILGANGPALDAIKQISCKSYTTANSIEKARVTNSLFIRIYICSTVRIVTF